MSLSNVFLVQFPNFSLRFLLLFQWLKLLLVQSCISGSTFVVSLYINSCILTSFPLPFAQHFCLRVLPHLSVCLFSLFCYYYYYYYVESGTNEMLLCLPYALRLIAVIPRTKARPRSTDSCTEFSPFDQPCQNRVENLSHICCVCNYGSVERFRQKVITNNAEFDCTFVCVLVRRL